MFNPNSTETSKQKCVGGRLTNLIVGKLFLIKSLESIKILEQGYSIQMKEKGKNPSLNLQSPGYRRI